MPDAKDVALKIEDRINSLINVFKESHEDVEEKKRLGVVSEEEHNGMGAIKGIFERQIAAQKAAHKLSDELIDTPPEPGTLIGWDDPWMQHMTMWLDAMIDEVQEVRGWLNWKSWKKPKEITENDILNARLELIDILHFWINAYAMLGGKPENIVAEYHAKRDENDDRQKRGY